MIIAIFSFNRNRNGKKFRKYIRCQDIFLGIKDLPFLDDNADVPEFQQRMFCHLFKHSHPVGGLSLSRYFDLRTICLYNIPVMKSKQIQTTISNLTRKIRPTLIKHDVVSAALFGSYARGENRANSDVDILVRFRGRKSLLDLVALETTLKGLLKRNVDLLTYKSIHPLLKDRILSEQKKIL